jgi:hypothetical chaperone protein
MQLIQRAKLESDQPEHLSRLEALVNKNYGLALFHAVERAKVKLSDQVQTDLTLAAPELALRHDLSRAEFEAAISPQLQEARLCVEEAINASGLTRADINLVVTTGGSSHIPAFRTMLRETLPNARIETSDAFTSVAAGLAVHGFMNQD